MPSSDVPTSIENRLLIALEKARTFDSILFTDSAHEQAITHKLAQYLERAFSSYDVDCEYNRHNSSEKSLPSEIYSDPRKVKPDIVVHHRGDDSRNLLVIEVKKHGSLNESVDKDDEDKLVEFTRVRGGSDSYGYEYGLYISLVLPDFIKLVWFKNACRFSTKNYESIQDEAHDFHYFDR